MSTFSERDFQKTEVACKTDEWISQNNSEYVQPAGDVRLRSSSPIEHKTESDQFDLSLLVSTDPQNMISVLRDLQALLDTMKLDEIEIYLRQIQEAVRGLSVFMKDEADLPASLRIITQIETVEETLNSLKSSYGLPEEAAPAWSYPALGELEVQMIASGWCPNHVHMCRSVFGPSALIYSSKLSRPFRRTHPNCTALKCVAYRVEERRVTKHREQGCTCAFVGGSEDEIRRLTQEGRIPLVRIARSVEGHLEVSLVPFESGMNFVAISHVWSHGLANASGNSLPVCQVDRVFAFVSQLASFPHYFWLDTLCVPRNPVPLRRLAIQGIRRVYEEASSVLVLDEELLTYPMRGIGYEAKLMMINLSGWMRRLWTLHEHIRAHVLHFQFADGTCSDQELLNEYARHVALHRSLGIPYHNVVASRAVQLLSNAATLKSETNGPRRMARMWFLLRWRHLSWPEDETILMMNMLGLAPEAVNKLLQVPKKQRMRKFIPLFEEFPADLLFLQVPKMRQRSLGWAPASWLHCMEHLSEQSALKASFHSMGVRTDRGLRIRCRHLTFETNDKSIFCSGRMSLLHVRESGLWISARGFQAHRYLTRRRLGKHTRLAICLEHSLMQNGRLEVRGALVVYNEEQPKKAATMAQFVRNLVLRAVDQRVVQAMRSKETSPEDVDVLECKYSEALQSWCIG